MWVALMEPSQMIFTSSLQPAWKDQRYRCGLVRQIRDLCTLSRMPVSPWPGSDPPAKRYRAVLEPVRPRTEENVPAGVDVDSWLKGCSTVPLPGFTTKIKFLLAPQQYWTRVELWVHPTTTVGDAKHFLEAQSFPHGQAELFGTETKTKLGWREPLLVASEKNWSPLEDRVVVPSTTRLDMSVCECGCSQWLLGLLHDMTPRPYCKMWGSRLFACACQGRARAGPRGLVRQAGV